MFNGVGFGDDGIGLPSEMDQQTFPMPDPMDIDFDLDLEGLSWANEVDHPLSTIPSPPEVNMAYNPHPPQQIDFQAGAEYPADLLFLEDEGTLPVFYELGFPHQVSHGPILSPNVSMLSSDAQGQTGVPGEGTHIAQFGLEQLRHQLSLLAGGSCGDELVFKDCEPSKAIAVHNLALEFGLNYTHDAKSCAVSLSRNRPERLRPMGQKQALVTAIATSGTVTDQAPAPDPSLSNVVTGTDDFNLLYEKFIQEPLSTTGLESIPRYELTETYLPNNNRGRTSSKAEAENMAHKKEKDIEHLERQPSRSERLGRSISKHVSGWKTTVSKGGRRGPLTQDGRRDMKVLEGAGGACWRCKVLKRKVNKMKSPSSPMMTSLVDQFPSATREPCVVVAFRVWPHPVLVKTHLCGRLSAAVEGNWVTRSANKYYAPRLEVRGSHTIQKGVAAFDPGSRWTASMSSVCLQPKARGLQT